MTRNAAPAAAAAAAIALSAGVWAWSWRTGAVGGSDSACYALMARVFADGAWQPLSVLAADAPWPEPARVAAPAGFLPSPIRAAAAVPVCAPGYSLLLAPLVAVVGDEAIHVVPAVAVAALVWLAFLLGRSLASDAAGLSAAVLTAATPIVLFQAVQPMNDIATGALWVGVALAACRQRPVITGLLVGAALLVRPNLAAGAATAVLGVAWLSARPASPGWPLRALRSTVVAGLAAVPSVLLALLLNDRLYGSPFQSGYGDLGVLFAFDHVPVNIARYGRTWLAGSTPVALLSVLAWWGRDRDQCRAVTVVMGLAASLAVVYLAYRPFDEWWYLRFLLPSVALAAVLTSVTLDHAARRWAGGLWAGTLGVAVLVTAAWTWLSPQAGDARGLQALEARFPHTAAVVAERLDQGAVPITIWQSGGLRFWPGREVVVWDALDAAWLDDAVAWLQTHGRQPAIVVERWEEAGFRERFAGQTYGGLDWPPRYDVDRRVRIFLPEDRERYLQGEAVVTETIFGAGRRR